MNQNQEETDDIMGDIRSAMEGAEQPEPQMQEQAVNPDEPAKELEKEPEAPEEGEKGPARGPDGKFVAKTDEPAQDAAQQPLNEVAEPPSQAVTRPPSSWAPAAKAEFDKLPESVRQAVMKREQEIDSGLRRKSEELKRYEPLEQALAPHRQKWALAGVDEATAVKQLLAASDWLDRDPQAALAHLARQYGVNLQAQPGQPQAQPEQSQAPQYTALERQLQELRQQITSQSEATLQSQIDAFAADPANLYFENVRSEMAKLIESGMAKTLPEAYEMACNMRPDIRPLLQKAPPVQKTEDLARKKAAAGSVTGAPGSPVIQANGNGSIEDDIKAAMSELAGAA